MKDKFYHYRDPNNKNHYTLLAVALDVVMITVVLILTVASVAAVVSLVSAVTFNATHPHQI